MVPLRYLTALLAGTLVLTLGGVLLYGTLLPSFLDDFLDAGSSVGVAREPINLVAVSVGMLASGALLTLAISFARLTSTAAAAGLAALVTALQWIAADWLLYAVADVGDLRGVLIDPVLKSLPAGAAGGAIAMILHPRQDFEVVARNGSRRT